MPHKTCKICQETKPLAEYHKNAASTLGVVNTCRTCVSIRNMGKYRPTSKAWYERNAERIAAKRIESFANPTNKIKRLLWAIKARAQNAGIPFDIRAEDITTPTHCRYLGVELDYNCRAKAAQNSASIDRIVPSLGYVKGNVQVISKLANGMKQDATQEQLETFARNVLNS